MTIDAGDVRAGKCFLSKGEKPQVMRVKSLRGGIVAFEARGSKARKGDWPIHGETPLQEFLLGALTEVGSDYDLGLDRNMPS